MPSPAPRPRLLLLGWAGADWQLIQPLLDAGQLPHLESLVGEGVMGNLLSLTPRIPPLLWTSIATGRRADTHGILDYVQPDPGGAGLRPTASSDRHAPSLWQILGAAGRPAAAVGWPATHPATARDALVVSDAFAEARGATFDQWPLRRDAVSDPALRGLFADLRLHPAEVTAGQLLPFVPQGQRIDQETDPRLPLLAASLARTASLHAAGTWIAEHREWDLLAIHFDLIERLSAAFLHYRAPRMAQVTEADFEIYREVVDGAYRFMDLLLGRYLELIGRGDHVLLVSDHGFLTGPLRPGPAGGRAERVTRLYREFGILVLNGPGIRRDELVFGATLLDVAPTALTLLGHPLSRELEGRVLAQAFEAAPQPGWLESYPHPPPQPPAQQDPDWSADRVLELVTLGYLPTPAADPAASAEQTTVRRLNALARVKQVKREYRQALEILDALLALDPEHPEGRLQRAQCLFALDDTRGCRAALDDLAASGLRGPLLDYLYGQLCAAEGDAEAAREHLRRAGEEGLGGRQLLERIGHVHLQARQWAEAEQAFRSALEIDPEFALAHNGLGVALAQQARHSEAIEHLLRSIGLLYHQPDAHYNLALSLAAVGRTLQATEALQNALAIQPDFPGARATLGRMRDRLARRLIDTTTPREEQTACD